MKEGESFASDGVSAVQDGAPNTVADPHGQAARSCVLAFTAFDCACHQAFLKLPPQVIALQSEAGCELRRLQNEVAVPVALDMHDVPLL
jgi:hypothetical protein